MGISGLVIVIVISPSFFFIMYYSNEILLRLHLERFILNRQNRLMIVINPEIVHMY